MKKEVIAVYLRKELIDAARKQAEAEQRSLSNWLDRNLERILDEDKAHVQQVL